MKTATYFAYGSNLSLAQMHRRCPSAVVLGRAALPNHRLAFAGHSAAWGGAVAHVARAPGDKVEGILYLLTERDVEALDRCEGVPIVYDRVVKTVVDEHGRRRRAHVYRLDPELAIESIPGARYFEVISSAYRRLGFARDPLHAALARVVSRERDRIGSLLRRAPFLPAMHRVFVYGTLRAGESNHGLLAGARFVGLARTRPEFRMFDLGPYPAITAEGSTAIEGEVYEVDDAMRARLDRLEGHPTMYTRTPIVLADGSAAEAYLMSAARLRRYAEIRSGNWLARGTEEEMSDEDPDA
jgi:gamma-glutamylcyclotransferase (GGCT)/AIG2-like uncharacterized protein YtfP